MSDPSGVCSRERLSLIGFPYIERHFKQMSWHPNFQYVVAAQTDNLPLGTHLRSKIHWIVQFTIRLAVAGSSSMHKQISLILTRISIATILPILIAPYANVNASLIPPMFRETRQTNAMTSQLVICNRPSDGKSSAWNPFVFKYSMIHWLVQFTQHFAVSDDQTLINSYWPELVLQQRFCKRMSDLSGAVSKRDRFCNSSYI